GGGGAGGRGKLRGLGRAGPIEGAGGPSPAVNPDTAELRVNADGSISVFAGTTSMGQGNETAFTQIVSERTGVPPERIKIFWGDSDLLGAGRGNGGGGGPRRRGPAPLPAPPKGGRGGPRRPPPPPRSAPPSPQRPPRRAC